MPDPTNDMRALFDRAADVLGSPVASLAGGLAEALDEVERLRKRDPGDRLSIPGCDGCCAPPGPSNG